jgi:hypothetical protein
MKTEHKIAEIVKGTGGKLIVAGKKEYSIQEILLDSRKLIHPAETLFFCPYRTKTGWPQLYRRAL